MPADFHVPVIDCDSHLIEPADLWVTRMPSKYKDLAPRVEHQPDTGRMRWRVGRHLLTSLTTGAYAGWKEPYPSIPSTVEEADPACYDPVARVQRLDEHGIDQQLLFPNLLGFQVFAFADLEGDLGAECVRAYNDFQNEFCSVAPARLIPQMFLPFWDLEASLVEMRRCADLGHRAINFGVEMERIGLPSIRTGHWDPLFAQAQELGLPLVFHIGFSQTTEEDLILFSRTDAIDITKSATLFMMGNAAGIVEIILSGTAHRFPDLNFVSIESGFGYVPYLLESLEWQYCNMGGPSQRKDWLLPTEYFRRQIYVSVWFESNLHRQIDMYPDNVMFSSDFPHPTSLSPGPGSIARNARDTIEANLSAMTPAIRRKVLHDNAARVYHLD
jgi:predicted TIM-barrel fold metal-dependent hydrolase